MSLKEKKDARSYFYLAREYMYYKRYNEAIDLFIEYLKLSNWKEERAACKRYIDKVGIFFVGFSKCIG